ncbi:hypothetical protein PRZ48_011284 [Zasmidium cellare]|uniref:Uncharacterized protein n=1 Tax=Zasmidium cellare TaxID=395010 RepID=A0ABR0E5X6_ZASCE|nr:hypothetical protein PRZ48_011284 [Zasmidium cellare]
MGCGMSNAKDGSVQDVQCTDAGKPAGFMILNSMINTSIIFTNIYAAMGDAQTSVNGVMGTFANTFAPIDKSGQKFLHILFDFLALGYASYSSVGARPQSGKPIADDIKDETNAWVTQGLKITHDLTNNEESFNNAADLSEAVNKNIGVWRAAVSSYQSFLFDGSQDSIDALHNLITSGRIMETGARQTLSPAQFLSSLSLCNKGNVPVIFDTGLNCKANGDRPDNGPKDVSAHNWACVDSKFYYIKSAQGREADCTGSVTASHCVDEDFGELDGIDTLDGKTWNGLLGSDLVAAAVNSWLAAGKKNGADLPDVSDGKTLNALYDQDVHAPGLVAIPICSEDEARSNWKQGHMGKNYPCNS